jgi:hypothetical protein
MQLLALTVLLLGAGAQALDEASEQNVHQQAPMATGSSVSVENGRGDVWLEGGDKDEIVVDAHKVFEGNDASRARWMRETRIRLEGDEHHRIVQVEYPLDFFGTHWAEGRRGVNLTIHVPRRANVDLKIDRGHLSVRQIVGKVDISSDRGDVDVSAIEGELRVHGDRGHLKVTDTAIHNGLRVKLDRGSADIRLKQFAGDSDLEIDRGDLSIAVPAKTSFTLDSERSRRTNFHTDFPVLARGSLGTHHIRGDINGGGPVLRLRGDRGSVWLRMAAQ